MKQLTNNNTKKKLAVYQELNIDINYHFGNFLGCLTGNLDERLPMFKPTEAIKVRDSITHFECMFLVTNCSLKSVINYWKMLKGLCGGHDEAKGMLDDYMIGSGTRRILEGSRQWHLKLDGVQNGRLDLDITPDELFEREMTLVIEELGIYCKAQGSSFSYFVLNRSQKSYTMISRSVLLHRLEKHLTALVGDRKLVKSKKNRMFRYIQCYRQVKSVGSLAGYDAGVVKQPNGDVWLASKSATNKIAPLEGDFSLVTSFLEARFCSMQMPYLIGWLSQCIKKLYAEDRLDGRYLTQAAVFLGDSGISKSVFQEEFLSRIFWNRYSDFAYGMTCADSAYNDERGMCEHLLVGGFSPDCHKSKRGMQRIKKRIKEITSSKTFSLRRMYCPPQMVMNMSILTLSTYLDENNSALLTEIASGELDGKMQMFVMEDTGKEFMMDRFPKMLDQLPAFIHYLLHLAPMNPSCSYGSEHFIHPRVLEHKAKGVR